MDRYCKIMLTIIAGCLVIQTGEITFTRAQAFGKGQEVIVTNYATDTEKGELLLVHCTNCNK